MNPKDLPKTAQQQGQRLELDQKAIDAAKKGLEHGTVTPSYGPWRDDIVRLLNDALATEIVCILRYKRHYYTAKGLASPAIADEFMVHAQEETAHSEKLAERVAIEAYTQMIALIGDKDSTTRRMLEEILAQEQEHAEELTDWLDLQGR